MSLFTPKLNPGERLIGQLPARSTKRQLLPGIIVAVVVGAVYFGLAVWLREPARALVALPASIGISLFVLGAFWNGHFWAVALTDWRLLVRRGIPWQPPDEIPCDEIDSVTMDCAAYTIRICDGGKGIAVDPMRVELQDLKRLISLSNRTTE